MFCGKRWRMWVLSSRERSTTAADPCLSHWEGILCLHGLQRSACCEVLTGESSPKFPGTRQSQTLGTPESR